MITDFQINGIPYNQWLSEQHTENLESKIAKYIKDWKTGVECIELHTSGSTGRPKSIEIRREYLIHSAKETGRFFNLKNGDRSLLCLPIEFTGGRMMLIRTMVLGLDLVVSEPQVSAIIKQKGLFKFCAMTPLQVSKILEIDSAFFDRIEILIIGGGQIDRQLENELVHLRTNCFATFGMTETISHIALRKIEENSHSIFKALPGVSFNVNSENQLTINAPKWGVNNLMTNDMVSLHSKTEFVWEGRIDNVINSGGVKLFPEKIEAVLSEGLSGNFFIDKLPDKELGNRMILVVEGKKRKIQLDKLEKLEVPKEIFFIPQFLFTETGKVDRKKTVNLI